MKHKTNRNDYFRIRRNTPIGRAEMLLSMYNQSDKNKGRGRGDLTSQWIVDNIFSKPCAHCGETDWHKIGCNRLDNSKPHTMDNVEPCCGKCNSKLAKYKIYQYKSSELIKIWNSAKDIVAKYNIPMSTLYRWCSTNTTKLGFTWSYTQL